ncbi:MAG: right-handed parallel beta-helix repeat-containing protein [Planctomycetota bacterium]|jgi:hypothetical protein
MRRAISLILFMLLGVVFCLSSATAGTHEVNDIKALTKLLAETAEPGDVIEIQPGVYYAEAKRISVLRSGTPDKPIIVRGVVKDGERPVIDAGRVNTARGVIQVEQGAHDIVFENLEIRNAAGSGRGEPAYGHNAAGMRFIGSNITVRNCRFHHNENGLFSSHGADYILIENCEIDHNGTLSEAKHAPSHNFYFNAQHEMVRNCYIHHSREGENYKSRADHCIFAFNRVEEDYAYSVEVASNNRLNALWLGNLVVKRTELGHPQGRLLSFGDGMGGPEGTLVVLNNTFITMHPRDYYLLTQEVSTGDVILMNNVFAGPGQVFLRRDGRGAVTGSHNWIQAGAEGVIDALTDTLRGEDPGFADRADFDFRPKADSPLVNAGAPRDKYAAALAIALEHAASGTDAKPSPIYLKALEGIRASAPANQPPGKAPGALVRPADDSTDIGAYEYEE